MQWSAPTRQDFADQEVLKTTRLVVSEQVLGTLERVESTLQFILRCFLLVGKLVALRKFLVVFANSNLATLTSHQNKNRKLLFTF